MKKILVFGSGGLVGNSLKRTINEDDFVVKYSTREDTNLFSLEETQKTINEFQPNIIINLCGKSWWNSC